MKTVRHDRRHATIAPRLVSVVLGAAVILAGCSGGPAYLVRGSTTPGAGARLEVKSGPLSSDLRVEQIDAMLRVPKDALTPELVSAFMAGLVDADPAVDVAP